MRFACASKSTNRTLKPIAARAAPVEATEVVLPTPPLWFDIAIIRCAIVGGWLRFPNSRLGVAISLFWRG